MKPRLDPRVFLALPLSRTVQGKLAFVQTALQPYLSNWHYIPQLNFHITLLFIGEVDESTIPEIHEICRGITPRFNPFSVQWNGMGFFGSPRNARVLFAKADECQELTRLAQNIRLAFNNEEERPYHAHITLAKARSRIDRRQQEINANMLRRLRDLGRIGPELIEVDFTTVHRELVLMETIWVGRAVEYQVRERYPFGSVE